MSLIRNKIIATCMWTELIVSDNRLFYHFCCIFKASLTAIKMI
jgi:hypothetical protein